jgi:hypothetical protein
MLYLCPPSGLRKPWRHNKIHPVARLFISQGRLDTWSSEDRVKVEADLMTVPGDGRAFRLRPAVRFLRVAAAGSEGGAGAGPADPHGLIGRVKPLEELVTLGGEQFMESVIVGDTAYDVQSGFLGEPVAAPPRA